MEKRINCEGKTTTNYHNRFGWLFIV